MPDSNSFRLRLFGNDFLIDSDEPDLVKSCLEANFGAAYCLGSGETGSDFFRLQLQHGPVAAGNDEVLESVSIPLEGGAGGYSLILRGSEKSGFAKLPPPSDPDALRLVFSAIAAYVHSALKERGIFFIHAAAVERNGAAILFAGPNGCGKSSLARALFSHGAGYLSDDAAPLRVNAERFMVLPSPEVISIAGLGGDESQKFMLSGFIPGPDPRFLMPPAGRKPVPVTSIFFPESGESPTGPESLTKKEALIKILRLNKTPLADGDYEEWFKAAAELAEQAQSARVVIRPGSPFPISKVIEFCDSI